MAQLIIRITFLISGQQGQEEAINLSEPKKER